MWNRCFKCGHDAGLASDVMVSFELLAHHYDASCYLCERCKRTLLKERGIKIVSPEYDKVADTLDFIMDRIKENENN